MATAKTTTNDDFVFDDFEAPVGEKKTSTNKVIDQIKAVPNEEEEDEGGVARLDTEEDEPKKKGVKKKVDEEDNDDDDPIDEEEQAANEALEDFGGESKKKPIEKGDTGAKPVKKVEAAPTNEDDDKFYVTLAKELKDKNVLQNVDVPDDLDEDGFFELQEQEFQARVTEKLQEFVTDLDDDGKDFIKFKKNGGSTLDFLERYASASFDIKEFDEDNDKQVDKIVNHYLINYEGIDGEELADRKNYLKESGKTKTWAKKWFGVIKDDEKQVKEDFMKSHEKTVADKEKEIKMIAEKVTSTLKESKGVIGDFPISKTEVIELDNYINKATVKVGKNKMVPAFTVDLAKVLKGKTDEDIQSMLILAKLLRKKFKLKDIATKIQTTVTQAARTSLKDAKSGDKVKSTGASTSGQSLADLIDE